MASTPVRLPFSWLGRHTALVSLGLVVLIGAGMRFWQLPSLPPGLDESSARLGLQALDLLERGAWPLLNSFNGYAPIWVWLQATSIGAFGHTELALRAWPALLGTLAIITTWLWAKAWFSVRVAWLAAFLVAVTPWTITLSRSNIEATGLLLLVTLTLWLATRASQGQSPWRYLILSLCLSLNLLAGPVGWLITATTIIAGAIQLARKRQLLKADRARWLGLGGLVLGLAGFAYVAMSSLPALKSLGTASGFVTSVESLGQNLVKVLLMFNVSGDQSYRHNLAGEPVLNVFVGLMLITGILVSISRLHELRYRLLFIGLGAMLLPAILTTTGVPNAARAAAAAPLVLGFAAVGISYLLELWYATFPINSAARATGQSAILILLVLTAFQGYTQYFRAWAGSSEVYLAHHEGITQLVHRWNKDKFTGQRYLVANNDEHTVASYLAHKKIAYQHLSIAELNSLPVASTARQFMIASDSREEAAKILKLKFPGGVLRPHYSTFNQAEIYYSYEIKK